MALTLDEIKGYERLRATLVEKLNALRQAHLLETDASRKFAYEQEIRLLENQQAQIDKTLADAYNLGTDSGKERLREKIKELKISGPMGRLHLVNCDRQEVRDLFEEGFDRSEKMRARNPVFINHFYFLSACPKQLPPSLGERMVYELLGELLDEGRNAVHCRFDPIHYDRVKLEKLPLGISEEKSQEMFRDFCARWFGWDAKLSFSEAIAANCLPLAKNEYAILPFKLRKKEWKPFFVKYFNWMAQQLAERPTGGPTLLIFIVLHLDNLHKGYEKKLELIHDEASGEMFEKVIETFGDEKSAEIIASINDICQKHPNARHFYPLTPVEEPDLTYWFNDLGEMNNARIQPVLDTVLGGLTAEELEQYHEPKPVEPGKHLPVVPELKKLLNMDRIELVQELVFDLYNK